MRVLLRKAWLVLLTFWAACAVAQQRFPPPDFEGGHQLPVTSTPGTRGSWLGYLDVVALATALGVATWFIYRKRSRKGLVWLSLFSVLYFGFWRKGCVCSIGSLQNVSLALFDHAYAVPIGVLAFFVLPLLFALFSGRAFCSAVCPHGALQDLVLVKPVQVPGWLERGLNVVPFIYLGAAVLFAATGSQFIICQYDPFIPIFRISGRTLMMLSGAALLLMGMFVGRPYCRFLCPYGALLKLCAAVAKRRVRVTPDYCTQCRLCETSCPFGAMRTPETDKSDVFTLAKDRRRLGFLLVLMPALIGAGIWLGGRFALPAARVHPTVALADRFVREPEAAQVAGPLSPDDLSLARARESSKEVLAEAAAIQRKFAVGGWIFGGWLALVISAKLIGASARRRRTDYEPERGDCFACARCFEYCPNERVRLGIGPLATPEGT